VLFEFKSAKRVPEMPLFEREPGGNAVVRVDESTDDCRDDIEDDDGANV
jgi:hypothetical protein